MIKKYKKRKSGEIFEILIDEEDEALWEKYNWIVVNDCRNYYLQTNKRENNKNKTLRFHRIILKAPKGIIVDHINGNGLDNRKSNLRTCTTSQNGMNRRKQLKETTSKYKGVTKDRREKVNLPWRMSIYKNKDIYIKYFKTENEAALAYNAKAKELFGEFTLLNKVNV